MKLNNLRPKHLKPLANDLRGMTCDMCNKTQSSWCAEIPHEEDDNTYICALCMLYETDWGKHAHARVEVAVRAQEKARNKDYQKDDNQRLTMWKEADNVLGSVILAVRMAEKQEMVERLPRKQ